MESPNKAGQRKEIIYDLARDFFARQAVDPMEYFVYFEGLLCSIAKKDPPKRDEIFTKTRHIKRGRGE